MPTFGQWMVIAGNCITVLTTLTIFARFAWKKISDGMRQNVTAPIEKLTVAVDKVTSDLTTVQAEAMRANERLDRHLESHGTTVQKGHNDG